MKRLFWILPLIMVFALTGCGTNEVTESKLAYCESKLSWAITDVEILEQRMFTLPTMEECKTAKLTWAVETGVIETWTIDELNWVAVTLPMVDIFKDQPKYAAGDYTSNTAQLNAYAHTNGINFPTIVSPTTMVVTLKKPVETKGRNLILYVNPKWVSRYCWGRFLTDVEVGQDTFEFDLTDMDIQLSSCDGNRTEKFGNATEVRVWGYITEYNWNKLWNVYFK